MPVLKRWAADKVRRPIQHECQRYKKREEINRKIASLSDSESGSNNSCTEIEVEEDSIFSDNEI